jgi:hypothetical protein
MGWEIYPEGLERLLVRFAAYGLPILVTESGVADRAGSVRPSFIRSHIYAIDRARARGRQRPGYLHWSLMDNFEWSHGYEGRFGLYTIDFAGDPHAGAAADCRRADVSGTGPRSGIALTGRRVVRTGFRLAPSTSTSTETGEIAQPRCYHRGQRDSSTWR